MQAQLELLPNKKTPRPAAAPTPRCCPSDGTSVTSWNSSDFTRCTHRTPFLRIRAFTHKHGTSSPVLPLRPAPSSPPTCVKAAEELPDGQQAVGGALQQRRQPQRCHLDGCKQAGRSSGWCGVGSAAAHGAVKDQDQPARTGVASGRRPSTAVCCSSMWAAALFPATGPTLPYSAHALLHSAAPGL